MSKIIKVSDVIEKLTVVLPKSDEIVGLDRIDFITDLYLNKDIKFAYWTTVDNAVRSYDKQVINVYGAISGGDEIIFDSYMIDLRRESNFSTLEAHLEIEIHRNNIHLGLNSKPIHESDATETETHIVYLDGNTRQDLLDIINSDLVLTFFVLKKDANHYKDFLKEMGLK